MIRSFIPLVIFSCAVSVFADEVVDRYDISLEIFPSEGSINAEAIIILISPEDGFNRFELLLNKNLELRSVSGDIGVDYEFARARAGEFYYSVDSAPIIVGFHRPLKQGEKTALKIQYQGVISETYWGENFIKPEWIEIAFYCGWFPLNPDNMNFRYDLDLKIDPAYKVTGNGIVSGGEGLWHIKEDMPTNDVVVIACKDLKTRIISADKLKLRFEHPDLKEETAKRIVADVYKMVDQYSEWFEHDISQELTFVVPRRSKGGGYYRPRFFTMPFDSDPVKYEGFAKNLAHEIAHFWWRGADSTTWEDWLNESFAEYSSLMMLRDWYGEELFSRYLNKYREAVEGRPPIWGIDRSHKDAFVVLYWKGSLILNRLEGELGREKFFDFLSALLEKNVKSTGPMLSLLEEISSKDIREIFEADLRK
jgi:hypothetical protein